jgi:predicted RNA-binding Zn ribbon-like protein
MLFTHDTEVALAAAAALVNTDAPDGDELPDLAALNAFFDEWQWTGRRARTNAELDDVRALRPRLRAVWTSDVVAAVRIVNTLLAEFDALPQLVRHDNWDWHLHATSSDAPLAQRMAVEAAMAFVDVIRAGELHRLKICSADDCGDVYVDLSKNRSRRFCDGGCANRTNVAAYRARQAGR